MKRSILSTALLSAMAVTGIQGAHAFAPITFDADGAGGDAAQSVNNLDWAPSSALAKGGNTGGAALVQSGIFLTNTTPFTFDLFTHGFLTNVGFDGLGADYEVTFVSRFPEVVDTFGITINTLNGESNVTFSGVDTASTNPNFFEVYFDDSPDTDDISGTGFNDGTLILEGTLINDATVSPGNFGSNLTDDPVLLDNFDSDGVDGTDNEGAYTDQETVVGSGATGVAIDVTFQDFQFFKSIVNTLTFDAATSTQNSIPFNAVEPSEFFAGTAGGAAPTVTASLGAVNGGANGITPGCDSNTPCGPDFLFQVDAQSSFNPTVPEPASLALLGAGMLGFGFVGRRNRRRTGV